MHALGSGDHARLALEGFLRRKGHEMRIKVIGAAGIVSHGGLFQESKISHSLKTPCQTGCSHGESEEHGWQWRIEFRDRFKHTDIDKNHNPRAHSRGVPARKTDMANDSNTPEPQDGQPRVVSLADARMEQLRREKEMQKRAANDEHQPILRLPPVIKTLCLLIIAVFAAQQLLPIDMAEALAWWGGFVPARYSGGLPFDAAAVWSPLTHTLLHGGWLHIGMNIGMLMAFGAGLEKQRGGKYLLVIFIISALGGALTQYLFYSDSTIPMIGASGGISGLFGAALMEMALNATSHDPRWRTRLRHIMPFVAVWIGISLFFGIFGMPGENQPVAWAAHVGGFIAGMAAATYRR